MERTLVVDGVFFPYRYIDFLLLWYNMRGPRKFGQRGSNFDNVLIFFS